MALMPWNDALVLGIAKIDEQHRWLVDRINAMHDELSRPAPDRKIIENFLESLVDYTMNHFIMEEELCKRHGYPQIETHQEKHNNFSSTILRQLDNFVAGNGDVGQDTMMLLKDWWTHHILTAQKTYVPFLKSKGE